MDKTLFAFLLALITYNGYSQSDSLVVLDLQQCIDLAIENNLSVKRSNLDRERARVNLNQARANQLPDVNMGANYGYNWGRSIDPTTNDFITQQITFSGFSGSSGVTIFNWFRLTNSVRQNKMLFESADYDTEKAKNDISLDIVTFYLNVIFNRELLQNAQYQLKSGQEQLERTKKLVKGGALPRTRELELISQVATNEVNLVNAENNLNLALLNLKQAMLIPISQKMDILVPELDTESNVGIDVTAEEVYIASISTMPEIQSAKIQVESALMGVKIAEAGYTPSLSLNGTIRSNYSDAFKLPTPGGGVETVSFGDQIDQNLSRSLSLNLSVPIFNNLQARSNVQRAKINLQQAEIVVQEQENMLRQIIESAYNDAQAASKTYAASLKQVAALEETFRSVENQYNLGAANFTDYQVASNNLFGARTDLVRAKYDFIFKKKILDFYQGKDLTF